MEGRRQREGRGSGARVCGHRSITLCERVVGDAEVKLFWKENSL